MNKAQKIIRDIILKTNHYPVFNRMNKIPYEIGIKTAVSYLKNIPGIVGIYLRGSIATGNFNPGRSDIDIVIVGRWDDAIQERRFIENVWRRMTRLGSVFPFFHHAHIFSQEEVGMLECRRSQTSINTYQTRWFTWKRLWGEEFKKQDMEVDHHLVSIEHFQDALMRYFKYYSFSHIHYSSKKKKAYLKGIYNAFSEILRGYYGINHETKELITWEDAINQSLEKNDFPEIHETLNELKKMQEGSFPQDIEDFWIRTYSNTISFLNRACAKKQKVFIENKVSGGLVLKPSKHVFHQETLEDVTWQVKPLANNIYDSTKDDIINISLGSIAPSNYDYAFYITLKEDIGKEGIKNVITKTRECYQEHIREIDENYFKNLKYPIIVTKNMLETDYLFYMGPVEHYYRKVHENTIVGKPLKLEGYAPPNILAYTIASNTTKILHKIRRNFGYRYEKGHEIIFKTYLLDLMTGIIPATRLMIDKQVVVTTPLEALNEYQEAYDDDYTSFLKDFYKGYAGRKINELDQFDIKDMIDECFPHIHEFMKETARTLNKLHPP